MSCSLCGDSTPTIARARVDGVVWQPCERCYAAHLNAEGIETGCEMTPTTIHDQWTLKLPDFRAVRSEWQWWERDRIQFLYEVLAAGQTIIDVGAEEGDLTALYALWGAHVVAFEPNLPVWANLKAIWDANDLPPLSGWFAGFAGDNTNDLGLEPLASGNEGWPDCAYSVARGEQGFASYVESSTTKPTVRIDDYCDQFEIQPDVITMDVEGAELKVLTGCERVLKEHRPIVVVSIHDEIMRYDYEINPAAVHSFMESFNYRAVLVKQDGHEGHFAYIPDERVEVRVL